MRENEIKIRLSHDENALLEMVAKITHPTEKGANVARMIRESAVSDALVTLAHRVTHAASLGVLVEAVADLGRGAALAGQRAEDLVDLTSLPTFGGEEPADTAGVWSWNETHLLVGEGDWRIVAREDA